jgi:hypothetical protein
MSWRASPAWLWMRRHFPEIVFLIATTAAGIWAAGRWMDPVGDTGFSWSLAYRLSNGARLYRDIYLAYGPLSPYLLAFWARVFGVSSFSMLVANWIPAIVAGWLLLSTGRRFLNSFERLAVVAMLLTTSIFAPGAAHLVFPYYAGVVHAFVFALAALLLLESARLSVRRLFFAGVLTGLAFCCKQEVGLAVLAALLVSLLALRPPAIRGAAALVLGGICAALIVAAILVVPFASLPSLRNQSHLWPLNPRVPSEMKLLYRTVMGLSDPNWFFQLRSSAWALLAGLTLFAALGGLLARERSRHAWIRVLYLALGLAAWEAIERFPLRMDLSPIRLWALGGFLLAGVAILRPTLAGRGSLIALGIFAGLNALRAAFSQFVSGGYDGPAHFASALTWTVLLVVLGPALVWSSASAANWTRMALSAALLLTFSWEAVSAIQSLRPTWKIPVSTPSGRVYLEPGQAAFLENIGRNVSTGERILVLPEINAVDALFQVRSVCPLAHYFPGWFDAESEEDLLRQLRTDPPAHVVFFRRMTPDFSGGQFGEGYGLAIVNWCSRNYRLVYSSPKGTMWSRDGQTKQAAAR